jgi:hypothetical protein
MTSPQGGRAGKNKLVLTISPQGGRVGKNNMLVSDFMASDVALPMEKVQARVRIGAGELACAVRVGQTYCEAMETFNTIPIARSWRRLQGPILAPAAAWLPAAGSVAHDH